MTDPSAKRSKNEATAAKRAEMIQVSTYKIAEAALAAENIHDLYHSIHEIIGQLMPARNFYIALVDPATELLHFRYWVDEFDEQPAPRKLRRGLTEFVLRTGEPQLVPMERYWELEHSGEIESIGTPSIDWLGVPLKIRDRSTGVLVVQSYTEGVRFRIEDKDILKFVSGQIAMAIERKRTEEELRASEAKFHSLFEHVFDGVYQTTPDGKIITTNPALVRMLGYNSEEELLQVDVARDLYVFPEQREYWSKVLDKVGALRNVELTLRRKDGSHIVVIENSYLVRDKQGNVLYQEGTLTDITERKRAEEEIQIQKAYFEQLFESAPEAIVVIDAEDRVTRVNGEFTKLFGYSPEEALGHPINELIVPPNLKEESVGLTSKVATGEMVNLETIRQKKDGSYVDVSILGTPIKAATGQIAVYGIYRDITERKRHEEERERLIKELKEALTKVRTLSGLLPICAACKKIRDDKGYWSQIEVYISGHSEADFSHGICPDCAKKLYPKYYKETPKT